MKLLFLTEYFPATKNVDVHGGVEVRVYKIAEYLSRKHSVVILSSREKNKPRYQKIGSVVVKRIGIQCDYSVSGKLSDILTRIVFMTALLWHGWHENFDLVEGNSHSGWFPAFILAKIKGKKAVALVADIADQSISAYISSLTFLTLRIYQSFILKANWDLMVCISNTVANKLINIGTPKNKICVIYCGTDVARIRSLKVKKNIYEIVCVSRLVHYKRVEDLILAFKIVSKKIPKAQLSIVGVGNELTLLKDLSRRLHLTNEVHFLEFVSNHVDVWRLIKRAGVFCLPSVVEGFGIVTVEAMAAGIPVVLADMPINHEITRNKGTLFFKPQDTEKLAQQLTAVMTSNSKRTKLIHEAKSISQLYDWRTIGAQTQKIYENLCIN